MKVKQKIVMILFLNIFCVIMFNMVCEVHYASKTDLFLHNVLSGAMGSPTTGHGWLNMFSGKLLETLYYFIPRIPWYAALQVICVFAALVSATYIIFTANSKWGAYAGTGILLLFLGYECYARISFEKTAAVCAGAACLVFYHFLRIRKRSYWFLAAAIVLFVMSNFWGYRAAAFAVLINFIPTIIMWRKSTRRGNLDDKKKLCRSGYIILIAICAIASMQIFSAVFISRMDSWNTYIKYQKNYTWLQNQGWPQYLEHIAEFTNMGITENSYQLLKTNEMVGDYVVSPENLETIKGLAEPRKLNGKTILNFTRTYPLHFFDTGMFLGFLVFVCYLYIAKIKPGDILYVLGVVWFLFLIRFLQGIDKEMHVNAAIWIVAVLALAFQAEMVKLHNRELEKYYSFMLGIMVLIAVNNQYGNIIYRISESQLELSNKFDKMVSGNKDTIFVVDDISNYQKNKPYYAMEEEIYENCYSLDSRYMLYNGTNLDLGAILNNEQFIFVSYKKAKGFSNYLWEYHGISSYVDELETEAGDIPLYCLTGR